MSVELAKKSEKKSIQRFYKANRYSASFIGFDSCYLIKQGEVIIACVIISRCEQPDKSTDKLLACSAGKYQYFLHGLVVAPTFRGQGLATKLLKYALEHYQPIICFAKESLTHLYLTHGFTLVESSAVEQVLLPSLTRRFIGYSAKENSLRAFINHQ